MSQKRNSLTWNYWIVQERKDVVNKIYPCPTWWVFGVGMSPSLTSQVTGPHMHSSPGPSKVKANNSLGLRFSLGASIRLFLTVGSYLSHSYKSPSCHWVLPQYLLHSAGSTTGPRWLGLLPCPAKTSLPRDLVHPWPHLSQPRGSLTFQC